MHRFQWPPFFLPRMIEPTLIRAEPTGLPSPAPEEPTAHEDAHFRCALRSTRISGLVDRPRCRQAWPLLQLAHSEDVPLRHVHQCATRPRSHRHSPEDLRRPHKFEGQDPSNPR